jgi:hypothetical protein
VGGDGGKGDVEVRVWVGLSRVFCVFMAHELLPFGAFLGVCVAGVVRAGRAVFPFGHVPPALPSSRNRGRTKY